MLDAVFGALGIDPMEQGVQIVQAHTLRVEPDRPVLVARVETSEFAAGAVECLLTIYPPDHPVTIVQRAGTPDEQTNCLTLDGLGKHASWDTTTCLYLPALDAARNLATFEGLRAIVARLRAPDGCPWDREQTHESLKPYVLEEAYEVLQALDDGDLAKLPDEMGDLLVNLLMQVQIASEAGEFGFPDLFRAATEKLIRRPPHVFGDIAVSSTQEVLANWEAIKGQERQNSASALSGIPSVMPALASSRTMLAKAGRLGARLEAVAGANPAALLRSVLEERPHAEQVQRLGDLLLGLVALSHELNLDPEEALRAANSGFRGRFARLEDVARAQGLTLPELQGSMLRELWQSPM